MHFDQKAIPLLKQAIRTCTDFHAGLQLRWEGRRELRLSKRIGNHEKILI
jgi:hypothetical protein